MSNDEKKENQPEKATEAIVTIDSTWRPITPIERRNLVLNKPVDPP